MRAKIISLGAWTGDSLLTGARKPHPADRARPKFRTRRIIMAIRRRIAAIAGATGRPAIGLGENYRNLHPICIRLPDTVIAETIHSQLISIITADW